MFIAQNSYIHHEELTGILFFKINKYLERSQIFLAQAHASELNLMDSTVERRVAGCHDEISIEFFRKLFLRIHPECILDVFLFRIRCILHLRIHFSSWKSTILHGNT